MLLREVEVVDGNDPGNGSAPGQYPNLLRLMKLIPERMGRAISGAMQSQVALIRYLAHYEPGVIQPARDQPSRVTTADGHDEIAECVAMPVTVGSYYRVGDVELLPRRGVVSKPRCDGGNRCEIARRTGCILCRSGCECER